MSVTQRMRMSSQPKNERVRHYINKHECVTHHTVDSVSAMDPGTPNSTATACGTQKELYTLTKEPYNSRKESDVLRDSNSICVLRTSHSTATTCGTQKSSVL